MNNDYHREYNLQRYHRWRLYCVEQLGGKCVSCGTTECLEFDHIDPATKKFDLGQGWARASSEVEAELLKCQLLCDSCHRDKSTADRGQTPARGTHGTLSAYRYCGPPKCEECRKAKRERQQEWRKTRRVSINGDARPL